VLVMVDATRQKSGRKGGAALKEKYGPDYFIDLGRVGGAALRAQRGLGYFSAIGKKGGAVMAARGREYYRMIGKKGGLAPHRNRTAGGDQA
jgi:general stress protein YciG